MNADSGMPPETPVPVFHGGDLDAARRRFGAPEAGWLDLSTGISPWPYPFTPPGAETWQRLPGADALDALRRAAARCYGAPDGACVCPAAGTQAILQLLPRLQAAPRRVAVVAPTYGEHAATWAAAGHDVAEVASLDEAEAMARIVIVTNPNNPDGRTERPAHLAGLADRLAAHGGCLVVDEAFADTEPASSLAPRCDRPGLIVLRSFGKFHGLAGIRLGFALAASDRARALIAALGPWAVSGPALAIGTEALLDDDWQAQTRLRLARMAARLDAVLAGAGLPVIGGTSLFRLAETPDAAALHERLGAAGILVRPFPAHPDWLRFGLPADEAGLDRLAAALDGRGISSPGR